MTSIEQTVQQIESEIQIDEQGRGKASIKATARLAGVSDVALLKAFQGANLNPSRLAQRLMSVGFDAANLGEFSQNGVPDVAIAVIVKYYAYQAGRHCTQQAMDADNAFSAIGIRSWMQKLKGWGESPHQKHPAIAVFSPKEEIECIQSIKMLLLDLGGEIEARDRILLSDLARNVAHKMIGAQLALPAAQEVTISERAVQLGYRVDNRQLMSIGRKASTLYQAKYGKKPSERRQWVDGAPRLVKSYTSDDLDIIDTAIKEALSR